MLKEWLPIGSTFGFRQTAKIEKKRYTAYSPRRRKLRRLRTSRNRSSRSGRRLSTYTCRVRQTYTSLIQISFGYSLIMQNRNKNICRGIGPRFLKRKLVKPVVRLIERTAKRQNALMKRTLAKVQDVEDSVEIIARDIKRKSDSQN